MKKLELNKVEPKVLAGVTIKGSDSIIQHIFDTIGTTNKFCVEFGTEGHNGNHCSNTFHLKKNLGWTGIMFDMGISVPENNLHQEFFTRENICDKFRQYNIPKDFDYLSVDVDGNDFWLLSALLKEFRPRAFQAEVNMRFQLNERWVLKYDPNYSFFGAQKGKGWYGVSPRVLKELGDKFGYTAQRIVFDDMFFVSNENLHPDDINIPWEVVYPNPTPEIYDSHNDPVKNEAIWMNLGDGPLPI